MSSWLEYYVENLMRDELNKHARKDYVKCYITQSRMVKIFYCIGCTKFLETGPRYSSPGTEHTDLYKVRHCISVLKIGNIKQSHTWTIIIQTNLFSTMNCARKYFCIENSRRKEVKDNQEKHICGFLMKKDRGTKN